MLHKNYVQFWNRVFLNLLTGILLAYTTTSIASQDALFIRNDQLEGKQLIQMVLDRNPSIEAMQSAWQAAVSRIDHVDALDDPMLSYSFAPETRNAQGQDFGQKIQLSQKLPWPGKLELRGDNARFEAQASRENIGLLQLQLIEVTAHSFADWYYFHEALRINQINQALWKEFKDIAEVKYSTGRASKQDAIRADVESTMLEHQAIVLTRKQRNILAKLNTLLDRAPDAPLPPPAPLTISQALPSITQLRTLARSNHPELKMLLARQHAKDAQVSLAEREYYPDFNLSVGHNSLWNQEEKRLTVGVGINIPLAQGKRDARVSETRARALQMKWLITDKRAEIAGAVQRAYNGLEESLHVLTLYKNKLLPLAEENLQTAKTDYQSGKGNFLDLVSAEKNLIQTQLNHVQAQADFYRHLAMLANRVGDPKILDGTLTLPDHMRVDTEGKLQ